MSFAIVMPQLGLTMEEGTVSAWLKKKGDTIKKDDLLFSVATDKVDMEVESPVAGTLGEIIVQTGETVKVGTVLAYVEHEKQEATGTGSEHESAPDDESPPSITSEKPQSAS